MAGEAQPAKVVLARPKSAMRVDKRLEVRAEHFGSDLRIGLRTRGGTAVTTGTSPLNNLSQDHVKTLDVLVFKDYTVIKGECAHGE